MHLKQDTSKRYPFRDHIAQYLDELLVCATHNFTFLLSWIRLILNFCQTESENEDKGDGDDVDDVNEEAEGVDEDLDGEVAAYAEPKSTNQIKVAK